MEKATVSVNGQKVSDGFIKGGTTYVPVRAVAESIGFAVNWDGKNKHVGLITK